MAVLKVGLSKAINCLIGTINVVWNPVDQLSCVDQLCQQAVPEMMA